MSKYVFLLVMLGCVLGMVGVGVSAPANLEAPGKPLTSLESTLFIGTYTKHPEGGIYGARFNAQTGELSAPSLLVSTSNPSFLAVSGDGRFLYAVNEWGRVAGEDKGGLSAFRIEPGASRLTPLSAVAMDGTLCYLTLDASGKWLFVAAYSAGTVSTWPVLADGQLGPRVALMQHTGRGPNEGRQREPHAHHIVLSPDNKRVFVTDLGIDQVRVYDFDATTGALVAATPDFVTLTAGAGPRHLALSPSGQFLYVVSELNNTVTVFKEAQGRPQQTQVVSTLPADFAGASFAAEIAVHPSGRFLYASNRGHNSLACYSIGEDGQLQLIGSVPTGRDPRHFTFDPSGRWLLCANQSDHSVSVFRVDEGDGHLALRHQLENLPEEPVCLLFGRV